MPSTYKAPGVYVEEITKFPPSVAAVETAIPAFIGYTEIAEKNGENLTGVPLKIESFLDYVNYFGGPPPRDVIVRLNTANQFVRIEQKNERKPYLLFDSVRLFYDNGGGICYIVSVGDYDTTPNIGNNTSGILSGLLALEKFDEPTLLLSPDAVNTDTGLYMFQQQALAQCNKLQDRFLICDLLKNDEKTANETLDDRVDQFRDAIGINYLKYGAAYVPWLRTSLSVDLSFRDLIFAYESDAAPTAATSLALLLGLTNSPAIQQLLYDITNAIKAVDDLDAKLVPGGPLVDVGVIDLRDQVKKLRGAFMTAFNNAGNITLAAFNPTLPPIYTKIRDIVLAVKAVSDSLPAIVPSLPVASNTQTVEFKLQKDINALKAQAAIFFRTLATNHKEIGTKTGPITLFTAGAQLDDTIRFLGYPNPPSLNDVELDIPTRQQYRLAAAREAVLKLIKDTATTAAALGGSTPASVATAVDNLIPATNNLKAAADTEIDAVKAVGGMTLPNVPVKILADIGAALPADKIALTMLRSYVIEETANGIAALNDLDPNPPGIPPGIADAIYQEIVSLKTAVDLAALDGAATPNSVRDKASVTVTLPRDYALIAANGAVNAAGLAIAFFEAVQATADVYEKLFNQSLLDAFGTYKTLVTKAGQDMMTLPPSGGVAGVYASVDSLRGVWKAPANASLASVLAPYFIITSQDQESLNVDANAGKSINAIRAFTGKGTLVWGTRTLAGNDNEWRYVPVRRYFNYAEESIKKATEPFVFEPNDINTWVRVKAMIENFLTLEWRRGALAGAKSTDAFYVKVGLGETMSAIDILEGRMIVEIGLAVVRPAEFIILRFAHKMQES